MNVFLLFLFLSCVFLFVLLVPVRVLIRIFSIFRQSHFVALGWERILGVLAKRQSVDGFSAAGGIVKFNAAPQLSRIEFNYATSRGESIYALALRKDTKNPFPTESDEVTLSKDGEDADKHADGDKKDEKKDARKEEKKKEYIHIDFDGLANRVTRVPL